jgi:hypothetical protein
MDCRSTKIIRADPNLKCNILPASHLKLGGAIGEVVAEMFKDQRPGAFAPDSEKSAFNAKVLAYSKLVSGAVATYAGGTAQTAITTSEVAVANNFLTYNRQSSRASQWGSFKRELDSCKVTAGCDVSGVYNW